MINIPNYEIGKLAGKGGVAEVYLAKHTLLDRNVAIKLISPARSDEISDKRFLKEARVVAGLRHANIVSIYDVGIFENKYYIIMEYLDGGDLKQLAKRGMSIEQSLDVLRQIAGALQHAHDKGFIHRDIKSQNIMFRSDGTAVLTDFGIVKDISADSGYTLDGTSIGTPNYMSPEQALGSKDIDWRTDIYSLGVTFYEMLTGLVPYIADSAIAVALKHIKDPVPTLPESLSHFQPIIDKTMAKKPEDRFQSARELLKALDVSAKKEDLESSRQKDQKTGALKAAAKPPAGFRKMEPVRLIYSILVVGMAIGFLVLLIIPYLDDLLITRQTIEQKRPESSFRRKVSGGTGQPFTQGQALRQTVGDTGPADDAKDELIGAIAKKNYSRALQIIEQNRQELPAPSNPMLQKADDLLESNQLISAGDMYNTVLSVEPGSAPALLGLLHVAVQKQKELTAGAKPSLADNDAVMSLLNKAVGHTNSPYIKQMKINVLEWIYESAGAFFKQNDLDRAQHWVNAGLKFAPDHLRMKKLGYLVLARRCIEDDRLTMPDKDNALFYYEEILKMDRGDPAAKKGISDIVDQYGAMARKAWRDKRLDEALQLVGRARAISALDKSLTTMEWLIKGDRYASASQYTAPEKENAFYCYQQARSLSPKDKEVMLRIAKSEAYLPLQQIQNTKALSSKTAEYKSMFAALKRAVSAYGREATADLEQVVLTQVKSDIQRQVDLSLPMPADFIALASTAFPREKAFFVSAEKALRERVEISGLLSNINNINIFNEKTPLYLKLFDALDATLSRNGNAKMADLKNAVLAQIRKDVYSHHINRKQEIPGEFYHMALQRLPEISEFLKTAQYDILIAMGDYAAAGPEKSGPYLSALALSPKRSEAIGRIKNLTAKMDAAGKNEEAVLMLHRALEITPANPTLTGLLSHIARVLDIFATASAGCGKENSIISKAPMTIEELNLCIQYKNMIPDSIITVVFSHENIRKSEVPVVLQGRSGQTAVTVSAPLEGFMPGQYVIAAIQGASVLSETRIQFITPKRR